MSILFHKRRRLFWSDFRGQKSRLTPWWSINLHQKSGLKSLGLFCAILFYKSCGFKPLDAEDFRGQEFFWPDFRGRNHKFDTLTINKFASEIRPQKSWPRTFLASRGLNPQLFEAVTIWHLIFCPQKSWLRTSSVPRILNPELCYKNCLLSWSKKTNGIRILFRKAIFFVYLNYFQPKTLLMTFELRKCSWFQSS